MPLALQSRYSISIEKQGPRKISKPVFPLRYGKYSEIRTSDYEFIFNLNGEIKFIRGLNPDWPHPAEQLKRTDGHDWVYYTVGDQSGDTGLISWLGEYYMPCLPYPSNPAWESNYLAKPQVMNAFAAWSQLYADLFGAQGGGMPSKWKYFIDLVLANDERRLYERSRLLQSIIGERISVLPPDTRHVDYEVIPLIIAEGCLYHCKFCCIKSNRRFQCRSPRNILEQIDRLKTFYGRNCENYNALFLGNHDALAAGSEMIELAANEATEAFGFEAPGAVTPKLYMFGSVDSLLDADDDLFDKLNQMPYESCINIGLESVDPATLAFIHKPLDALKVREAFQKMGDINAGYNRIELTGNFLLGEPLSSDHYRSLGELLADTAAPMPDKGALYLSPLKDSPKKRELLPRFFEIKQRSRWPVYIYLIQRL